MVLALLGRFARAAAKQGLGDIAVACIDPTGISAVNYLGKVAAEVWKDYRQDKKQDKLQADILEAAKLTFEEAKQAGLAAAQQATTDPELQGHIERLVTLIPASIRASLRRPEDPTGTTLPKGFEVHDEQDIVKLLPVRLPRFKAGDTPLWLRGWRLVEQIGAGGFGEVWKVQNTRASNLLGAVKFSHGMSETEFSLLNEGDVLNRLLAEGEHEGIVPLQDMWADGDPVPWIRFKYIEGGDLTTQIHRWQTLPVNERLDKVIAALSRLAKTVGYFHRLEPKIVHRDLKPSNILVEAKNGNLLIADFGIGAVSAARAIKNERSLSQSQGAVIATYLRGSHTPLYASKQQKEGSRLIDPRDDVHALGVITYQMLTGQLDTAPGTEYEDELKAHGSPDWLIALIKQCVSKDPARRPADGLEIKQLLKPKPESAAKPVPEEAVIDLRQEPEKPTEAGITADPVTQFAAWKAQVEELWAQAEGAADVFDYARAVELYAGLPAKQRDESKLSGWTTRRDRLGRVWGEIESGWKEMTEDELAGKLDEVLQLHPDHAKAKPWRPQIVTSADRLKAKLAKLKAGDRHEVTLPGGVKMSFAWCPPGTFIMGDNKSSHGDEKPAHEVRLTKGFWMGVTPVTQAQWQAIMGKNPSYFMGPQLPVELVSWDEVVQFCQSVQKKCGIELRLPTEAEWEYACRAGTTTDYCSGNGDGALRQVGWFGGNAGGSTKPVGQLKANAWNLHDMHGNVWEWCSDWKGDNYYAQSPKDDPQGPSSGSYRVRRGGGWYSTADYCRTAFRDSYPPVPRGNLSLGFRVSAGPSGLK